MVGKKVYTVNGNMYIIDDETGKILTLEVKEGPIPLKDHDELIKMLSKAADKND